MPALGNPSITSPREGARTRARNPRDITGRRHQELAAEKAEKDALKGLDVAQVRKAAWSEGFDAGFDSGVQAIIKQLEAEGIIDTDEPGTEAV